MRQSGPSSSYKVETIDNLINAIDIVNSEATLGGIGRKSADSKGAFINGIKSIRSIGSNY